MLIKLNLQRFAAPIGVSLNVTLDSGIESIHMTTPNEINTTITTNGSYGSLNNTITTFVVTLKNGYIMDKMLVGTSEVTATSENTYKYTFNTDEIAVSFTSKKSTSQVSIDLTTLSGWGNVANGQHSIQVVAKADGYKDSEPSAAVSVEKATAGYTVTITEVNAAGIYTVYINGVGVPRDSSDIRVFHNVKTFNIECQFTGNRIYNATGSLTNVSWSSGFAYSKDIDITEDSSASLDTDQ